MAQAMSTWMLRRTTVSTWQPGLSWFVLNNVAQTTPGSGCRLNQCSADALRAPQPHILNARAIHGAGGVLSKYYELTNLSNKDILDSCVLVCLPNRI